METIPTAKDELAKGILEFFREKHLRVIDWEKSQGVDYNLVQWNQLAEILAAEDMARFIRNTAGMVLHEAELGKGKSRVLRPN